MNERMDISEDLKGYQPPYKRKVEGPYKKMLAHLHAFGPNDDGIVRSRKLVDMAAEQGYDLLMTPHNSLRSVDWAIRYQAREGYGTIEIVPGLEYASVDPETGRPKHVLLLGADETPSPGLSEAEINRLAWRKGWFPVAAHLGLGGYSTDAVSVRRLNTHGDPEVRYGAVEVYNSAVAHALNYANNMNQWPLLGCLGEKIGLPQTDLNYSTQQFMNAEAEELGLVEFAGSDSHSVKSALDVVLVRPEGLKPVDAIATGNIDIYVRKKPAPVTLVDFAGIRASNIAGKVMQRFQKETYAVI